MHFQRVLSILFLIVLLFSFSVPAFAEKGIEIQEGYNIECVPYSPYISSLVVTDNTKEASVYYSASKARTYSSTASTFSATSFSSSNSSTDYIYSWDSFNSLYYPVRNSGWIPTYLIYSPEAGGNIANPYYTLVSDNTIRFNGSTDYHPDTSFSLSLPLLKVGNKYRFTFTIKQPNQVYGILTFSLVDSANSSNKIDFCSFGNSSTTFARCNTTVSGDVIIPDTWSGTPKLVLKLSSWSAHNNDYSNKPPLITLSNISFIDVTNENLDKSLDKFGDRLENAGSGEPPLDTDISAFQSAIDTMNGWLDQLDTFADTIDTAGQTANDYITKGTEIFNGFMSVAPSAVIALVAFGVVFIVVRKIVGR